MTTTAVLTFLFLLGQAVALRQSGAAPRLQSWFDFLASETQFTALHPGTLSNLYEKDRFSKGFPQEVRARVEVGSQLNSSWCRENFRAHPDTITCPDSCPYLRHEATGNCLFKCVRREHCKADDPLNSFADDKFMICRTCKARACEQCGSDAWTCSRCHGTYELVNGECVYRYSGHWYTVYALIGVLVSFVVAYVVSLAMRPVINEDVSDHALRFRNTSKIIEEATGKPHKIISTDVRRKYVNGVATMLHFQWQYAVIWWSIFVFAALGFLACRYPKLPDIQSKYDTREAMFDVCNLHVSKHLRYFYNLEHAFFYVVFVIYIVTSLGCVAFAVFQKRWANKRNAKLTTMQDYVLIASGFPEQSGEEPVEEDLKEFFEEALEPIGVKVVGVSACWDSTESGVQVKDLALRETDKAELIWEAEQGLVKARLRQEMRRRSQLDRSIQPFLEAPQITAQMSELPTVDEKSRSRCSDSFKFVDSVLCFQDLRDMPPNDADEILRDMDEIQRVLGKSRMIGSCYLVLNTEKERDEVYEYCQSNPLRFPIGMPQYCQSKISVSTVGELEPEVVEWSNYGISDSKVNWNMLKGVGVLILVITVLDVCFYFPYMSWVLKSQEVKGMSQGDWKQGFLLGLLITVCNQIIYAVALLIADNCGFKSKDEHTKFYVVAYTAAVSINTFVDLWLVSLLARGYVVDHGEFVDDDAGMSMKALAENYALQMSLYHQIWAYIFPGTLLAPYICEPIVVSTLFRLRLWIVRSRKISVLLAEELLMCPPFDLSRYGDILIIALLCSALCLFTYRDLWTIFGCAVVSLLWIYNLDRFRLLRFSSRASFVNQRMSDLAHLLMAFPCCVLSACVIFRAYASSSGQDEFMRMYYEAHNKTYHVASDHIKKSHTEVEKFLNRDTVVMVMITAAVLHVLVHWLLLKWLVPYFGNIDVEHNKEVPYAKCAEEHPCNWFNANPMFCLRSKYYYRHDIPCTQFKPGKEHILQVNHSIGQYFAAKDYYEQATEAPSKTLKESCREINDQMWDEVERIRDKAVNIKRTCSGKKSKPLKADDP